MHQIAHDWRRPSQAANVLQLVSSDYQINTSAEWPAVFWVIVYMPMLDHTAILKKVVLQLGKSLRENVLIEKVTLCPTMKFLPPSRGTLTL